MGSHDFLDAGDPPSGGTRVVMGGLGVIIRIMGALSGLLVLAAEWCKVDRLYN